MTKRRQAEKGTKPGQNAVLQQNGATPLEPWQYLAWLAAGLLPLAGMAVCLVWAFQTSYATQKQNLARAMLYIHGAGIVAALVWLAVWILRLLL